MRMRPRYAVARREACKLTYGLEPPIDVESLANLYGVRVKRQPYEGTDDVLGMYLRHEDLIGLNSRKGPERLRFTVAKLLGHRTMHDGPVYLLRGLTLRKEVDSAEAREDIEATFYAAELLMPTWMLEKEDLYRIDLDLTPIALSEKYGVTLSVAAMRLARFAKVML